MDDRRPHHIIFDGDTGACGLWLPYAKRKLRLLSETLYSGRRYWAWRKEIGAEVQIVLERHGAIEHIYIKAGSTFFAYEFVTTYKPASIEYMRYTYVGVRRGRLVGVTKDILPFELGADTNFQSYIGGEDDLFVNGGDAVTQGQITAIPVKLRDACRTNFTIQTAGGGSLDQTSTSRTYNFPWWISPHYAYPTPSGTRLDQLMHLKYGVYSGAAILNRKLGAQYVSGWTRYGNVFIATKYDGIDATFYVTTEAGATSSGTVYTVSVGAPSWTTGETVGAEAPTTWQFSPHDMRAVAVRSFPIPASGNFQLVGIQEVIITPTFDSFGVLNGASAAVGRELHHRDAGIAGADYDDEDTGIIRYVELVEYWGAGGGSVGFTDHQYDWSGSGLPGEYSYITNTYTKTWCDYLINAEWHTIDAGGSSGAAYRKETIWHGAGTTANEGGVATGGFVGFTPSPSAVAGMAATLAAQNATWSSEPTLSALKLQWRKLGNTTTQTYLSKVNTLPGLLSSVPSGFTAGTYDPDDHSGDYVYKSPFPYQNAFEAQFGYVEIDSVFRALDLRTDSYALLKYMGSSAAAKTANKIVVYRGREILNTSIAGTIGSKTFVEGVVPRTVPTGDKWTGTAQDLSSSYNRNQILSAHEPKGLDFSTFSYDLLYSTFYTHPGGSWSLFASAENLSPILSFDIIAMCDPKTGKYTYGSHQEVMESSRPGVYLNNYFHGTTKLVRNAAWLADYRLPAGYPVE